LRPAGKNFFQNIFLSFKQENNLQGTKPFRPPRGRRPAAKENRRRLPLPKPDRQSKNLEEKENKQ
jgi:hypothetical protein